ncbi:138_t:CDS:2 [Diversispora eburnea]|uniref:138_t:CDS:1 n=1 Tax=Diversispora eburnea TaxID=1213867 RepID=A0A9N8WQG3_9GLOM|nr:138_t:CDS:2 [Diversispora eburnea]
MQVHLDKDCRGAPDNAKLKKRTNPFFNNEQSNEQLNETSTICPSFKLPNRRKLATELLDKVFEEVKEESDKEILLAQNLCMSSDDWSNINQELFSAVITDTANDIIKINEVKSVVDDAKNIAKYFKSHTQSMAKFKCIQCENYESRTLNMEAAGYNEFTSYVNSQFSHEDFVEQFVELVKFRTIKILSILTSSAAAECNFSTFGFIHSKIQEIDTDKEINEGDDNILQYFDIISENIDLIHLIDDLNNNDDE